ncbi:hypothetical protein RB653_003171 [Dictyostelium firmibasis]|uniref:Uncharacterized protein n=1 Tax=Dictyostelium firmibasis TaxID=79012 RepID=A0AAN7TYU3_9MYCE
MFNKRLSVLLIFLILKFDHIHCLEKYASKLYKPPLAVHRQLVTHGFVQDTWMIIEKSCKKDANTRIPKISVLCVKECKEKMKEIYRITFEGYLNAVIIYYDDCKIFKRRPDPPIMRIGCQTYNNRLEDGNVDPEYRVRILKAMKARIINGKLVRLCDIPKGLDVEFETTGLTDSEGESEPEEEEEEYESDDE